MNREDIETQAMINKKPLPPLSKEARASRLARQSSRNGLIYWSVYETLEAWRLSQREGAPPMTPEDNERHFQNWLDKNSWRRDIQRLEKQYGAAAQNETPEQRAARLGPQLQNKRTFTDEFHFDAMSVVSYLAEALAYRPMLAPCPMCDAPVRIREGDRAHLCTVCAELGGI